VIVTAALIWYDENPEDLEACVRGIAEIADRLVAVDGAYRRYPDAQVTSPPEQAETIRRVAAEVGLECDVYIPDRLWAGQVEKRSFLMQRASVGTDWIAVVDADWVIHADRVRVRRELFRLHELGVDVITVSLFTPKGEAAAATGWHRRMAGTRTSVQHFFRPLEGLRVEKMHWWYSAIKNGQRVWMWHGRRRREGLRILPAHRLRSRYEIEHRTFQRDEKHILAGRAFCNDRELVLAATGQEDDVPGLPAPVFDYETIPY
jgi:hypothetical protein